MPPGEYRISVGQDASRVVSIAGDAVVNFDIPLVQIGGRVVEDGGTVPIVGAGVHLIGSEPQTRTFATTRRVMTSASFSSPGRARRGRAERVQARLRDASRKDPVFLADHEQDDHSAQECWRRGESATRLDRRTIRPLFLSREDARHEYGIGLWIPLNLEGVGYSPSALAGSTLRVQRSGSQPVVSKSGTGSRSI